MGMMKIWKYIYPGKYIFCRRVLGDKNQYCMKEENFAACYVLATAACRGAHKSTITYCVCIYKKCKLLKVILHTSYCNDL